MTTSLQIVRHAFDSDVVQALVADLQQEFVRRYGGPDETHLDAAMFADGSGAFFVGYLDEEPVGMGGWRRRPDVQALGRATAAEIKRMYVVPRAQRRGFARALLAHLEDSARQFEADLMVLESGLKQPEALALYESAGYVPIPAYGIYADSPFSRYVGKPL